MMIMKSRLLFSLVLAMPLALTSATEARPAKPSAEENVQVINVIAKKYEFDPSPIRVKAGTRVELKITAQDHAHGFSLRQFPEGGEKSGKPGLVFSSQRDCQKIEQGQTETVEFVAQTPGTYPFRCCVHCGWHHRSMKGQLIVEP